MKNNSTKNSTVLVVGATGVLGMEVCRQLAAAGKKVKGLVRISSQKEKVNGLRQLGVETVPGDTLLLKTAAPSMSAWPQI